jgi:hypothetical protein
MNTLMRSMIAAGGLAAGLALSAHDAGATVVNLSNSNFDANAGLAPNSDDQITQTNGTVAIPGWTIVGAPGSTSGTLAPMSPGGAYFNAPSITNIWSPPQVGAVGGTTLGGIGTSSIFQNTGNTWNGTSGTVTVTLQLGQALTSAPLGTLGTVSLLEGGLTFATTGLESGGGYTAPTAGNFATETYTFTGVTGISGDSVGIEFTNPDTGTVFLDDIALSGTNITAGSSIPEPPAGLPILGIALLGFVAYNYRHKTKMLAA